MLANLFRGKTQIATYVSSASTHYSDSEFNDLRKYLNKTYHLDVFDEVQNIKSFIDNLKKINKIQISFESYGNDKNLSNYLYDELNEITIKQFFPELLYIKSLLRPDAHLIIMSKNNNSVNLLIMISTKNNDNTINCEHCGFCFANK